MSISKLNDLPGNIIFFPAAVDDFLRLDKGRQFLVIKALQKIAKSPSQFGKPLENQEGRALSGFRSIYVDKKSLRIVWRVVQPGSIEVAIIAGVAEREALLVYKMVTKRQPQIDAFVSEFLTELAHQQQEEQEQSGQEERQGEEQPNEHLKDE